MLIVGVACVTLGCVIRYLSNVAVVNIKWNVLMNGLSVRWFGPMDAACFIGLLCDKVSSIRRDLHKTLVNHKIA